MSFLRSTERSPNTVKAYAHDLRDYEFLDQAGVSWDGARLEDAGRFVAWLRLAPSARQHKVLALPLPAANADRPTMPPIPWPTTAHTSKWEIMARARKRQIRTGQVVTFGHDLRERAAVGGLSTG